MALTTKHSDPLLAGFYTVKEAARLLRIDNQRRIYRWVRQGYDHLPSVIRRDYQPLAKLHELSFWDLIEVRFVEHFLRQKVSLQYLRKVAEKARLELATQHPFALSNAEFLTDRKRIFEKVAEDEGDERIWEILAGQYEMYATIEKVLAKGITFSPQTYLAEEWHPLETCPHVVVNPKYDYGRPVIGEMHVPTAAVFRQWKAENGDLTRVADWWGIKKTEVSEAVEFEVGMAA